VLLDLVPVPQLNDYVPKRIRLPHELFYVHAMLPPYSSSHRVICVVGSTSLFTLRSGAVFFSPLNCHFLMDCNPFLSFNYYYTSL